MKKPTRRRFLAMTGAAATAGVAAIATTTAIADTTPTTSRRGSAGPLVAHVADIESGAMSLMFGEQEVVVDDPDLIARLVRAAS